MALPGLQGYQGISDSEGEMSPQHSMPPVSGVVSSGLGIPRSNPIQPSPPAFVKPVVRSAPSIGLVDYRDEEEGMEDVEFSTGVVESTMTLPVNNESELIKGSLEDILDSPVDSPVPDIDGEPLFLPLDDVELPPEPLETCSQSLQDKIISHLEKKAQLGVTPYDIITKSKNFRNPSIYEKLIQLCNINEFGTNYSKDVFDPFEWKEEDYYDKLSEAQKKAHEMKQRARAERSKIEFKSSTKVTTHSSGGILPTPNIQLTQDALKKRKTKWDMSMGVSESTGSKSAGSSPNKESTNNKSMPVGAQALVNARMISKTDMLKLMKK